MGSGMMEQPSGRDRLGPREVPGEMWTDSGGQHVEGQAEGFEFQNAANDTPMMVLRWGIDVQVLFECLSISLCTKARVLARAGISPPTGIYLPSSCHSQLCTGLVLFQAFQ